MDGSRKIQLYLTAIARLLQEGAQRACQEFRSLRVQARCLMLYECHNVAGTQVRQSDGPPAKTILQKTADERNVVDDRGSGKAAASRKCCS